MKQSFRVLFLMILPAFLVLSLLDAQARPAAQAPTTSALGDAYFLYVQGRLLDGQDDHDGAIASLKRAVELLPGSADIRAELAGIYARQGQVAEARTQAQQALALAPDNRDAHRVIGWIEATMLERTPDAPADVLVDAIDHLEHALSGGANDPSGQLTLGELYVRNRQAQKAIALLNDFLDDHPDYPQALQLLGDAYEQAGQAADAARVRARTPGRNVSSDAESAADPTALEQQGRWKEAASAWEALVAQDPANVLARVRFSVALANSNDMPRARQVMNDVLRETPKDPDIWFVLFQLEYRSGNMTEAEAAATRLIDVAPDDPRGPMALAGIRAQQKNLRGLIDVLAPRVTAASAADVSSGAFAQMASQLGAALVQDGQPKQAVDVLEGALAKAPNDRQVQFSLANAYDRNKQHDRAERALRDIIVRDPADADALNYLGYMLADRGQKLDEAVALVKRALAIEAENPAFLDSLGWAYFKLSKYGDALAPLEQAAAALPTQSVIQSHLGDLYFQMKRYGDATAAFDRALAGDKDEIDVSAVTKKRDRASSLAGKR